MKTMFLAIALVISGIATANAASVDVEKNDVYCGFGTYSKYVKFALKANTMGDPAERMYLCTDHGCKDQWEKKATTCQMLANDVYYCALGGQFKDLMLDLKTAREYQSDFSSKRTIINSQITETRGILPDKKIQIECEVF